MSGEVNLLGGTCPLWPPNPLPPQAWALWSLVLSQLYVLMTQPAAYQVSGGHGPL